jgi:hypothetical protein
MRLPANQRKKQLGYPQETEGSRLAAKVRKLASKSTPEEEAEHFRRGMAKIYGSQPKDTNLLMKTRCCSRLMMRTCFRFTPHILNVC